MLIERGQGDDLSPTGLPLVTQVDIVYVAVLQVIVTLDVAGQIDRRSGFPGRSLRRKHHKGC